MLGPAEMDEFVSAHQWAVMTTVRGNGQPSSSVIGYARDGDELLIAASESSLKIRCLERNPRVTLCIFGDEAQPRFATIEGTATLHRNGLEQPKRRILANTVPQGVPASEIEGWLNEPTCVVVRVQVSRVSGVVDPAA
jgi:PPOX class probable F420-dependent enzyme